MIKSKMQNIAECAVCGESNFIYQEVLPLDLIKQWQLSNEESENINKQQGMKCSNCNCNLRSIALAKAIGRSINTDEPLISASRNPIFADMKVLEINEAGQLSPVLRNFRKYQYCSYPQIDMRNMPFEDHSYDLVIHSDTIEHIENPISALKECKRILKVNGHLNFTIPIVKDRLTRRRYGLEMSFHSGHLVHSEYGANAWVELFEAGFDNVSIFGFEWPAALAFAAKKHSR